MHVYRIDGVNNLFTFDDNGRLDLFKESAQSDSGVTLLLPGPGPMYVVGSVAYFQLFVIDPRVSELYSSHTKIWQYNTMA